MGCVSPSMRCRWRTRVSRPKAAPFPSSRPTSWRSCSGWAAKATPLDIQQLLSLEDPPCRELPHERSSTSMTDVIIPKDDGGWTLTEAVTGHVDRLLLYGPPGTGKSFHAQKDAHQG